MAIADSTSNLVAMGGQFATSIGAAGGTVVVKATPGRLCRLIVIVTGTAAMSFFDNASAASGTVLFTIPANAAVGTIYDIQIPAVNGIVANGVANTPGVQVLWT